MVPDHEFQNDPTHLHILSSSDALDIDGDGLSDAVARDLDAAMGGPMGLHAFLGVDDKPYLSHTSFGLDTDHDSFDDRLEARLDTDPQDPFSHPDIVVGHGYPADSGLNLPGTLDIEPTSSPHPWLLDADTGHHSASFEDPLLHSSFDHAHHPTEEGCAWDLGDDTPHSMD